MVFNNASEEQVEKLERRVEELERKLEEFLGVNEDILVYAKVRAAINDANSGLQSMPFFRPCKYADDISRPCKFDDDDSSRPCKFDDDTGRPCKAPTDYERGFLDAVRRLGRL